MNLYILAVPSFCPNETLAGQKAGTHSVIATEIELFCPNREEVENIDKAEIVDRYVGRHLRAHTTQRDNLVAMLDSRDSRNRKRGIVCAKRLIKSLGYELKDSDDRVGRYLIIKHTDATARRRDERMERYREALTKGGTDTGHMPVLS